MAIGWAIAAGAAAGAAASGGTLTIVIDNVRNATGMIHVDICPETLFLTDNCAYSGDVAARPGSTTVVVHGLPPGRYAAQAFHDENNNNKVDRALFGIPKEGVGFSHDARITFGPPKFADAAFAYGGWAETIRFRMRYFLGASGPRGGH